MQRTGSGEFLCSEQHKCFSVRVGGLNQSTSFLKIGSPFASNVKVWDILHRSVNSVKQRDNLLPQVPLLRKTSFLGGQEPGHLKGN